jgi:hypothetical protein
MNLFAPLRLTITGMALFAATLAPAEIEFIGVLATPKKTQFALTDTAAERTVWVSVGDTFSDYKLTAYDRATDTITLTKADAELRVRLKDDAKIKSARLELTGAITFGAGEKVEIERATLRFDEENVFPLKDGIVYRITPSHRDDGNILYRISIERTLPGNKIEKVSAPAIITIPGQPFSLQIGDAGFAFAPR